MPSWSRLLTAAVLLAGPADAVAQAPESCGALARFGAYDTSASVPDAERGAAFRAWVCQASIAQEADLREAGGALGIAPDLLEAALGFDASSGQEFLDWKHGFCATARGDERLSERLADFVKGLQPAATAALAACGAPPGLHARLEQTANPCTFLVRLGWTADGHMSFPGDVRVLATNPKVACQPTALDTPFAVAGAADLTCARHDDAALVVTVAAPSLHVAAYERLLELPRVLPDPQDLLGGDYDVELAWRERSGRFGTPLGDVWHLDLGTGACRITDLGGPHIPRGARMTQVRATCSPVQIMFAGTHASDAAANGQSQLSLTLRSEDNGASFTGTGNDSAGNIAVQATMRHRGEMPPPDQVVCKP